MLNRELLRIKVIQTLYARATNDNQSLLTTETNLSTSVDKAYELYMLLLKLMIDTTDLAKEKLESAAQKMQASSEEKNPNRRFVDNRFIALLRDNEDYLGYLTLHPISWDENPEVLKDFYHRIINADYFDDFMFSKTNDFADDKELWRKIFKKEILDNEVLDEALEDRSIYLIDDLYIVHSFVLKTIKQYKEEAGTFQALQPKYKNEDDAGFAKKLLSTVILNSVEYEELILKNVINWDLERIAIMDKILLKCAIAELSEFPEIPKEVTFTKYLEIAKRYSTDRSHIFIHGLLDQIVSNLRKDHKMNKIEDLGLQND